MSGKDAKIIAQNALDMIARIRANQPSSAEELIADADRWDAACTRVQVLGEAVVRIDKLFQIAEDTRAERATRWLARQYPEHGDLLGSLTGTRNVISHHYVVVRLDFVWALYSTELDTIESIFQRVVDDCTSW